MQAKSGFCIFSERNNSFVKKQSENFEIFIIPYCVIFLKGYCTF